MRLMMTMISKNTIIMQSETNKQNPYLSRSNGGSWDHQRSITYTTSIFYKSIVSRIEILKRLSKGAHNRKYTQKHVKSTKNNRYLKIPKMGQKKPTPAEAGKGQPTVASYYAVIEKPPENKNEKNHWKLKKSHYQQETMTKAMTMTVLLLLLLLLFERRKELLWDPTRHQRMMENI